MLHPSTKFHENWACIVFNYPAERQTNKPWKHDIQIILCHVFSLFSSLFYHPPWCRDHVTPTWEWVTFLEKMFCREKQSVAARALISPETSKDSSVAVASSTPPMMGMSDMYTYNKDHTGTGGRVSRRQSSTVKYQNTICCFRYCFHSLRGCSWTNLSLFLDHTHTHTSWAETTITSTARFICMLKILDHEKWYRPAVVMKPTCAPTHSYP